MHLLSGDGTHLGFAAALALLSWPWNRPLYRLSAVQLLQLWAIEAGMCWNSALLLPLLLLRLRLWGLRPHYKGFRTGHLSDESLATYRSETTVKASGWE